MARYKRTKFSTFRGGKEDFYAELDRIVAKAHNSLVEQFPAKDQRAYILNGSILRNTGRMRASFIPPEHLEMKSALASKKYRVGHISMTADKNSTTTWWREDNYDYYWDYLDTASYIGFHHDKPNQYKGFVKRTAKDISKQIRATKKRPSMARVIAEMLESREDQETGEVE